MKNRCRILVCLAFLSAAPTFAAKPANSAKPAKKAESALPSTKLRQLIDQTLPRINTIAGPNKVQDRTKLAMEQANFTASAQVAPPTERPMYQAAAGLVATLTAAVDEHDKAVANFRYSKGVHGAQDTKDEEISNTHRGWGSGRTAEANNAKQNKENADSRKELLAKEQFLSKGAIDAWTVRAGQLRAGVEQAYEQELIAEKQAAAARAPQVAVVTPPPPPKAPAPKPKELSAAQEYSPVGKWKGNRGAFMTLNEDNTATRGKVGGPWKWTDQAKGELHIDWSDGVTTDLTFTKDGRTLSGKNSKGLALNFSRAD